MTLADELRDQVERREAQERTEAEERYRQARKAMQAAVRREVPRLVKGCKGEAQAAAAEGQRSVRVHRWGDVAHHSVEEVSKRLRKEGFTVVGRADSTAVMINGDGYAVGGSDPYAVWELSW